MSEPLTLPISKSGTSDHISGTSVGTIPRDMTGGWAKNTKSGVRKSNRDPEFARQAFGWVWSSLDGTSKPQRHVGIHSFPLLEAQEMAAISQDTVRYIAYAALNVMIAREVNSIVVDPYMVSIHQRLSTETSLTTIGLY